MKLFYFPSVGLLYLVNEAKPNRKAEVLGLNFVQTRKGTNWGKSLHFNETILNWAELLPDMFILLDKWQD